MITFQAHKIDFALNREPSVSAWLSELAKNTGQEIAELNYIFCSDEHLLSINQQYLNHDYYTDIVTFDNSDEEGMIEGDIFISIDRVRENATSFSTTFEKELFRVIAHGLLHLIGFNDKTEAEAEEMRKQEELALLKML